MPSKFPHLEQFDSTDEIFIHRIGEQTVQQVFQTSEEDICLLWRSSSTLNLEIQSNYHKGKKSDRHHFSQFLQQISCSSLKFYLLIFWTSGQTDRLLSTDSHICESIINAEQDIKDLKKKYAVIRALFQQINQSINIYLYSTLQQPEIDQSASQFQQWI